MYTIVLIILLRAPFATQVQQVAWGDPQKPVLAIIPTSRNRQNTWTRSQYRWAKINYKYIKTNTVDFNLIIKYYM